MADVVESASHFPPKLIQELKKVVVEINEQYDKELISPLTITLGDEFQGIVSTLRDAMNVMVGVEEKLIIEQLEFKLRYVLYEGKIETEINTKQAYEMLGSGLTNAREQLISMKKEQARFSVFVEDEKKSAMLNQQLRLLQFFIDSWQPKDRSTVAGFLSGMNYKELAKHLSKDDSSVWRRRKSLAIDEYLICKELVYEAI